MKTKINDMSLKLFIFCTCGLPGILFANAPTGFIGAGDLKFEEGQDWTDTLGQYFAGKLGWVALIGGLAMVVISVTTIITSMLESKKAKPGDEGHGSAFLKIAINIFLLIVGVALISLFFAAQKYANQ